MGLLSYYLANTAIDRIGDHDLWIYNNYEWIDYLNDRVNNLEEEVK